MKYTKCVTLIAVLLCLVCLPALSQDFYNVKYLKNYDGDTYTFDLGENIPELFRTMPLRLFGIDTPEIRAKNLDEKAKGQEVRDFARDELKNAQQINLIGCKGDKYFRILCRVSYDGKDLTDELLKRNMGYPYFGGKKEQRF
ncbi:putative nuclease [Candidatus Gastranaerophilus sp. (ex Termes propinquus)]|nr:putative nuclease [Candidatus Gastranaerophilus sp. (ex Termes propinquus)]